MLINDLRTAMIHVPESSGVGTRTHIMASLQQYPNTLDLREIRISVQPVRSLRSLSLRQHTFFRVAQMG